MIKDNKKNLIDNYRINEKITNQLVRIVNYTDYDLADGLMTRRDAEKLRNEYDTDLIEISVSKNADNIQSICKMMDVDKFLYQLKKAEKERKSNQKTAELKEIKLGVDIAENDFNVKLNQAKKFLEQGDNVKVSLQLKGRIAYTDFGKDRAMEKVLLFSEGLKEYGKIVNMPKWVNNKLSGQINSLSKKK